MLFFGCCAVSVEPPVCVCVRSIHDDGCFAPKRSRISRAHIRRSARYFAISSKKLLCVLKIQEMRPATASTSAP